MTNSASSRAAWRELCAVLDEELTRLPGHYRAPLVLCYLEGKTTDQAAAELRVPRGTVASRLVRARQLLRRRLGRRGIGTDLSAMVALPAVLADVSVPGPLAVSTIKASLPIAAAAARRPWMFDSALKGWDLLMRLLALTPSPLAAAVVVMTAVATTSLTVLVAAGAAADSPELRAAKDAWSARQAAVKSLYVRYDRTLVPRADPKVLTQWRAAGGPVDDEYELAFGGDGRFIRQSRRRVKLFDGDTMGPEAAAVWFDGKRSWMKQSAFKLDLAAEKAGEVPMSFPQSWFQPMHQHYWSVTGFCPPNNAEKKPTVDHEFWRLPDALEWGEYRYAGEEAVEGSPCAVIEGRVARRTGMPVPEGRAPGAAAPPPGAPAGAAEVLDKLWLDRAHGWALRRREVREGDALILRSVNSAFNEVTPGLWLPMACAEDHFLTPAAPPELRGTPAFTIHIKVSKVSADALGTEFFTGAGK